MGAYIISDRHVKRLDRARGMSSAANREHFTSKQFEEHWVSSKAPLDQIIELAGGGVIRIMSRGCFHAQGYRHVTEEAVDRFTHSTATLHTAASARALLQGAKHAIIRTYWDERSGKAPGCLSTERGSIIECSVITAIICGAGQIPVKFSFSLFPAPVECVH